MKGNPISYAVPIAIELAGMFLLVLGIAVELTTQADLGYVLISTGSALLAGGSLIWSKILKAKEKSHK